MLVRERSSIPVRDKIEERQAQEHALGRSGFAIKDLDGLPMLEPEEERPALWAADPERVDPDDYPPGSPYAREMTWAPCPRCDADVHAPVLHVIYHGLACPRCNDLLLPVPEDPEDWVRRVLREEDDFAEQL